MSKGSKRRPMNIGKKMFDANWDNIFETTVKIDYDPSEDKELLAEYNVDYSNFNTMVSTGEGIVLTEDGPWEETYDINISISQEKD